jgi:hypothetical protein
LPHGEDEAASVANNKLLKQQAVRTTAASWARRAAPLAPAVMFMVTAVEVTCAWAGTIALTGADKTTDSRQLAGANPYDIVAFVAWGLNLGAQILLAPELPVQASRLGKGGVALGVPVPHAVSDSLAVWRFMSAWADDEFMRQLLHMVVPNLSVFAKFTVWGMLNCPQLLLFYSLTTKIAAVTTSTVQANAQQEFSIAQLEDELVFKGRRDVMGLIQYKQANTKGATTTSSLDSNRYD